MAVARPGRFGRRRRAGQGGCLARAAAALGKAFLLLCLLGGAAFADTTRQLSVSGVTEVSGRQTSLSVSLNGAGNENALSFSLSFDPAKLTYLGQSLGSGASGTSLLANTNQLALGRLGLALAKPAGQTFGVGSNELVRVRFLLSGGASTTAVSFTDAPLAREVVDSLASELSATYSDGQVLITALLGPTILTDPASQTIQPITNLATNVTFSVVAGGSPPFGYQWRWNGTNLAGPGGASLVLSNVAPAQSGNYDVVVTNEGGAITSRVAVLTVLPALIPPAVVLNPRSQVVSTGETVSLTVGVLGSQPLSYQWQFNAANLNQATNAALVLTNITLAQAGNYRVLASNAASWVASATATITVSTNLRVVRVAASSVATGGGVDVPVELVGFGDESAVGFSLNFDPASLSFQSVRLGAGAAGAGLLLNTNLLSTGGVGVALTRQAGQTFAGGTNQLVLVRFLAGNISGPATLAFGDQPIAREVADLMANPRPASFRDGAVNILATGPSILQDPQGLTVPIFSQAAFQAAVAGSVPLSFQWQWNGKNLAGQTDSALTLESVTPANAGGYRLIVTNAAGSATSAVATLTVPRLLRAGVTNGATGNLVELPIELLAAGDENAVGFSLDFDPTQMSATGVAAGTALNGAALNFNTNRSGHIGVIIAEPNNSVFGYGTQQVARVQFLLGQKPGTNVPAWSDMPVTRDLADTNANSLAMQFVSGSVGVQLVAPQLLRQPAPQTVWIGDTVTFDVGVSGSQPMSYQWQKNGADLSGATNATLTIANVQSGDGGNYSVRITNVAGPASSGSALLTVLTARPDLFVSQVSAPALAEAGQAVPVVWKLYNTGNADAPGGWCHTLWLASDSAGDNPQFVAALPFASLLPAGQSLMVTGMVSAPSSVLGDRYFVVRADGSNEVAELNENNNAAVAAQATHVGSGDLVLGGLSVQPGAQVGQTISVTWVVTNSAGTPANGPWQDRLYLSSSPNSLAGAVTLLTAAAPTTALAPGTAYTNTQPVTLPAGGQFSPGTYYLVAAADCLNNVSELTKANNLMAAQIVVTADYVVSATNNPPGAGTVSGAGYYLYGATCVLTAYPAQGYKFDHWSEGGTVLGSSPTLSTVIDGDHLFMANYAEANVTHVVGTGTSPSGLAAVAGAGSYTNGQSAAISAPLSITNPPNIYAFQQFQLNGSFLGNSASFTKTFSTLDPGSMQYVAVYGATTILPVITNVVVNYPNLVPATTNLIIRLQFNRSMNTNFMPLVTLTNLAASVQPVVPAGGSWSATASLNDTFVLPPVTMSSGMDGDWSVWVARAQDTNGSVLASTNILTLTADVTPPRNPVLALSTVSSTSAAVTWFDYSAPADLNGFLVYLSQSNFSSIAGMTPVSSLGAGARSFTYSGLSLDQPYYAAIVGVDNAGNLSPVVTPLTFSITSVIPPPVTVQVNAVGAASAVVSWSGYDTTWLFGFAGFQLYYETSNFSSVAGHTVRQTLDPGARSVQIDNLDRTKTWYFAVVGINRNQGFNAQVTPAAWSDPYAGAISANTTLGGPGQGAVEVLHDIVVVNDAVLTIPAGTTVRFAPGTRLTVQQGSLNASGTALDPIVFTSLNDQPGGRPAVGDWNGVVLSGGAGASVLRNVFINYGGGLALSNCSPTVDALTALYNQPAGLTVADGALLGTGSALLAFNAIGAQQLGAARLTITNSSIKNNGTNAIGLNGLNLQAGQNWWGSSSPSVIDGLLRGAVDRTGYLTNEPVLTPALGVLGNVTQVGSQTVNLRLACRTADTMRLSEDSTFSGVFFSPFTNQTAFQLSDGGGDKTIFAQFRSLTGQTSAPVSVGLTYITTGPSLAAFNLFEGEVLTRPVAVSGNASAALGMAAMEFYVDGVGIATNAGGAFSLWLDVRAFSSGTHRVELLARDRSGNIATVAHNVFVSPTPPPMPTITTPGSDLAVNTNTIFISGSAEPLIEVRLFRSGALAGTTYAAADGTFSFANVPLAEGVNQFGATAIDVLGSASSPLRNVTLDTMPPAQLILNSPVYVPGAGLNLSWHYPVTGKRASSFQVCWSTSPITRLSQAQGNTLVLSSMYATVQGLATASYYFYVVGYDELDNAGPLSAPVQFAYDAVPPSFSINFSKSSPVGVGALRVVLTSSKPLNGLPSLTVQPSGNPPSLLPLSNTGLNTYEADLNVTTLIPSGPVRLNVSALDLAGNPFNGAPAGPSLVIDVTPPSGSIGTAPAAPIQTTNNASVAVNLQLTEPPQPGTTPTLNFGPPVGLPVAIPLSGSGMNWGGALALTPDMGSGTGHFTLTVSDSLGNVGHSITAGSSLEIYNTALPTPPGQPVHFEAASLSGGRVRLTWDNVPNAETYRVYCDPGTDYLTPPTTLVSDNVSSNSCVHLPGTDGSYRLAVTALRRGAEGTNSIVRVALSDRTPPPAPVGVAAQLVANGLQISWRAGAGETPDHYNVYRNGALIGSAGSAVPVLDNPPRGVLSYTVSAADALGNEAMSDPVAFEALVGAVNSLQALVNASQAPVLSWVSSDPTAAGFNVYRNGIKQNANPLAGTTYTDSLPLSGAAVNYTVTALNSTNAESPARSVTVYPVSLGLLVNAAGGNSSQGPTLSYFDDYVVTVSNLAASSALPLGQVQVRRTLNGSSPLSVVLPANRSVAAGAGCQFELTVPCSSNTLPQSVQVQAEQQTDAQGSSVVYQAGFDLPTVQSPGVMVDVSANQLPLAGGLTAFKVRLYNRGFATMYVVGSRANGSQAGDIYISVLGPQGQEAGRTTCNANGAGLTYYGDVGYLVVPPGGASSLTVPDVLVAASLASNLVTFQAVVSAVFDRPSANGQQVSGPLVGSMQSSLSQTPYYGTAQTDHLLYNNDQPILITGQALDRITGLPVPNVPLKIGFSTRGCCWYEAVTTDATGNYSYSYDVTPGLAGSLTLWAAHPDVYDQLNQAQVNIYRTYAMPQAGDVRMSKNDRLPFNITLINPGDLPLSGFSVSFQAYQMQGTNQVPVSKVHGSSTAGAGFGLAAGQQQSLGLELAADADAPDNAMGVFTITSAEGATAMFTADITLLPAVPVVTVVQPDVGYVEVSVDRGALVSRQVTIMNGGLKDLKGVSILPPTNVTWMVLNLPQAPDGTVPLPDLAVGQSNTFTVVFTPPTNAPLGSCQDKLTIQGTNAVGTFDVNLYARVTSANHGAVQFYVDDILGLDVPNATVRLRNTALQVELPAVQTDINGLVTVTNLQEGDWSWQISASGHSANVGMVTVVADQTVNVSTRLNQSLVTINFSVTPVPYTDQYEITIQQTFETHVPAPVLVLSPAYRDLDDVTPGYQATLIFTAQNQGMIQMEDLTLTGQQDGAASLTPLITYVPVLLPQQSIDIPYVFTYAGSNAPAQQNLVGDGIKDWKLCGKPGGVGEEALIEGFITGLDAIANAKGRCIKDNSLVALAGVATITAEMITSNQYKRANKAAKNAGRIACTVTMLISQGMSGSINQQVAQLATEDFQVNGQNCEDTPDYDTGGD